jgi:hypothetical protein
MRAHETNGNPTLFPGVPKTGRLMTTNTSRNRAVQRVRDVSKKAMQKNTVGEREFEKRISPI